MIEALQTGMMANVSVGGEVSESCCVTNGVKKSCVLARTLFSIFLSAMLDEAFRDIGDGVWMGKVTHEDILERTGLPSMEDLLIRKIGEWISHEDVTIQATKVDYLLSTVFWSKKEMAPSSPVQGYHQEKPEGERHKYRLMDITLTTKRQMESNSQLMEAVFVASRPTA